MRTLLFCQQPYAFAILEPLCIELIGSGHEVLWFITANLENDFPFRGKYPVTGALSDIKKFNADVIFAPGNEVPHWLHGVKIQIFHGFAGEKKGHFRIRGYFDLYLTQGPWFTERFRSLAKKHRNFKVVETGWSKFDPLFRRDNPKNEISDRILKKGDISSIILYAPTFSPSLTSAGTAIDAIEKLSFNRNYHILIKFHDLMDKEVIERYRNLSSEITNIEIVEERNILIPMAAADILISDTSSAVYEFILLDKPVVTINSSSAIMKWVNITDPTMLEETVAGVLGNDNHAADRKWFRENFHPYTDGKSSARMIAAAEKYISEHGIPGSRKIPFFRKIKVNRIFGKEPL